MSSNPRNQSSNPRRKGKNVASGSRVPPPPPIDMSQIHFQQHFSYQGTPQPPPTMPHHPNLFSQQQFYVPHFANQEPVHVPIDEDVVDLGAPDDQEFTPLSDNELEDLAPTAKGRAKPVSWMDKELEDVAKAFIDCSEDPLRGNQQSSKSFWTRVTNNFNQRSERGLERSLHQVYSKWKLLNKYCGWFNGFYLQNKQSNPSGANDEHIIREAHKEYVATVMQKFKHEEVWQIIRDHPKWEPIPLMGQAPQVRTEANQASSGAHFSPVEDDDVNTVPTPSSKRGKKAATSSASVNISKEDLMEHLDSYSRKSEESRERYRESKLKIAEKNSERIDLLHQEQMRLHQEQLRILRKDEQDKDLDRFIAPHDHLQGAALRLVLMKKRQIAERWGWEMP